MESLISRNAKEVSEMSQVYFSKSRMKRINSSYRLVESVLSGRRSGADTVVDIATIEFRFRAIVLIEKFVLDIAYEKIGVAGSHFCAHSHTIDLFIITVSE